MSFVNLGDKGVFEHDDYQSMHKELTELREKYQNLLNGKMVVNIEVTDFGLRKAAIWLAERDFRYQHGITKMDDVVRFGNEHWPTRVDKVKELLDIVFQKA